MNWKTDKHAPRRWSRKRDQIRAKRERKVFNDAKEQIELLGSGLPMGPTIDDILFFNRSYNIYHPQREDCENWVWWNRPKAKGWRSPAQIHLYRCRIKESGNRIIFATCG